MPRPIDRILASSAILLVALSCRTDFELVVEHITTPSVLLPGEPFVASTRVCNDTDGPTPDDALEVLLRTQGRPESETLIFAGPVPPLEPGGCHDEEIPLIAPSDLPDGPYQLVGRLEAGGHQRASAAFGIGWMPDLVIESLDSLPSARPGEVFDVHARVCNQGTTHAEATQVALYLSEDRLLVTTESGPWAADTPVGSVEVPDLPARACVDVSGTAIASVVGDRPYRLGGFVDEGNGIPELVETNNRHVRHIMGVGWLPDLVVRSLSAPHATWNPGPLEVTARVCNDGTAPSPGAELAIYFSDDPTIEPAPPGDPAAGDPWLGSLAIPSLPPLGCELVIGQIQAAAPVEGEWVLGGVADEMQDVDELIEANNVLAGPVMGVGDGPDLVIERIDAPPSAESGMGFDVDVEVCNRGTGFADPSELRLYLSEDAILEPAPAGIDPEVAVAPVVSMAPGSCVDVSVYATASLSSESEVQLVAVADATQDLDELVESNNEAWGPTMGIGLAPDLSIANVDAPPSVERGMGFEVVFELCNHGTMPSPPSEVSFYHSVDPLESIPVGPPYGFEHFAGDVFVDESLMPGACSSITAMLFSTPPDDGPYHLGAIADPYEGVVELRESNNVFAGPLMGVGLGPDLVVASLAGPPSALPQSNISVDYRVCNQGTMPSETTWVMFYDSEDATLEAKPTGVFPEEDRWLGDSMLPSLAPGACIDASASVWIPPSDDGPRHLAAFVDEGGLVTELVESNNGYVGPVIGVGNGPDLLVTLLVAPFSASPSASSSITAQVCNMGTAPSGWTTARLYLSDDELIEGDYFDPGNADYWLADVEVPALAPFECHDEFVDAWPWVPYDGAWFLGAIVNEGMYFPELIESNNDLLGPLMGIGDGPDLFVASMTIPASAEIGAAFPVSAEVCNYGTTPSATSAVTLVYSEDDEITGSQAPPLIPDQPFAHLSVGPLMPDECIEVVDSGWASVPTEGEWRTGAIVDDDDFVTELIESNNVRVGPSMGVGSAPDLRIEQLAPPPSVLLGDMFPVDLKVCNRGTVGSGPTMVGLYYSDDELLSDGASMIDMAVGDIAIPALAPDQCHFDTKSLYVGWPAPGWLIGVVDEFDDEPELIETNNIRIEKPVVVTP